MTADLGQPAETCGADGGADCAPPTPACAALARPDGESDTQRAIGARQLDLGGTPAGYELKYFLIGSPIAHSPSPALHNAGFKACGLRHTYSKREFDSAGDGDEALRRLFKSGRFGGASVTIPLKRTIIPLLVSFIYNDGFSIDK